jgi:hypothetical protein
MSCECRDLQRFPHNRNCPGFHGSEEFLFKEADLSIFAALSSLVHSPADYRL